MSFPKINKEYLLVLVFIVTFILIRTFHFQQNLNFSTDQATHSSSALDIWRDKSLSLIGPRFTLEYNGRFMFMGPAIYYLQLLFLIPANFEPVRASLFFVFFAAFSLIPLYIGTKLLINKNAAILMCIFYTLIPYFINYSRFLWNPNYQLALLPYLILAMGLFKKYRNKKSFFLISFLLGFLLQFHYTFLIIIGFSFIYYFLIAKLDLKYFLIFLCGIFLANIWIPVFDLRHQFYLLNTLIIFVTHFKDVAGSSVNSNSNSPHYYLSTVFFGLLLLSYFLKKYLKLKYLALFFLGLLVIDLILFVPVPKQVYGMARNWSYNDELKVNQIITSEKPVNFNIVNLIYDPKAEVQKYLLKKEKKEFNDNYLSNDYLFVISSPKDYLNDPAFEIDKLQPAREIKSWKINDYYNLYLAHREPKI